jgi:protein-tyrosine phosphatase
MDTTIYEVQPSPEYAKSTVPAILEPKNFRQINDKIFAGGRPTIEQIRWLKEKVGIKSIVNLERWYLREGYDVNEVRKIGIEYINSPVDLIPCPAEDVKKALKEIKRLIEQGKTPIYIHCSEGVDRTGFVIAAYRVIEEGWDINKAIEKWKEEKTGEGKIIRFKAPFIWEGCFRKNFPIIENLQITEISPSIIETRERTYPVTLTLKGKGLSQVNEITFSWRGPDSGGPKIWKKGDKNWVNSLKIKSDEEMIVNIYVLRNEPPTNEVKEWTWTVTLKNDKGETASKEFKVRQLPIEYSEPPMLPTPLGSDTKRQQIPSTTETVIVSSKAKEIIKPSQLKFYRRQNAIANYEDCSSYYCSSNYIFGKLFNKGYILTFTCLEINKETALGYERVKQNPEIDFLLPTQQGRLQGVLGLLDRTPFVEKGAVGDEVIIGIYGDGRLIKTYSLQVGKPPQIVDLDVSGIERITIRLENLEKILQIIKEKHCEWLFVPFCLERINIAFVDSLSE